DVLARPAAQQVVAGAADQGVVAGPPDQDVVAVAAVLRELDRPGRQARRRHHVVAVPGADRQPVVGRLGAGDVHPRVQAGDGRAARVPGHQDHVVAVGPLHGDGVSRAVADPRAGGAGQVEVDLGHVRAGEVVDGDLVDPALGGEVDALDAVEVHGDAG